MNKTLTLLLAAVLAGTATAQAQNTPTSQMEKLNRGVVALTSSTGKGNFVSWRFLGTDDEDDTTFDLLRNGNKIASDLYVTNYVDASGTSTSTYQVVPKVNGIAMEPSETATAWGATYKTLTLDRPATGTNGGTYAPNDCSVGDVDGDGQYEIFVKWDPSNSKDNSQSGITDNVIIDCYKLDGTKLWRIDLGRNIRAGAHYTQFMVYDFDGDGKAEMMCKTGPGSLDSKGNYVNSVATEDAIKAVSGTALYRSSDGRITGGQEWLTVFSGETGEAIHTIFYNPNRNMTYGGAADGSVNWGDVDGKTDKGSYGNRGERFLAAVAYLDGPDKNPSGIFSRGYYGYAFIWAVDFDGKQLHQRWLSSHKSKTSYSLTTYDADGKGTTKSFSNLKPTGTNGINSGTMFGNGNHNLSIADVDGDGCDEIVWGSAGLNNDGTLLYATGFGHGDAIHLADHCPDRPGLEVFEVHEDKLKSAWDLHDAATGEVIFAMGPEGQDNGRGIAGQFDANVRGSLFWSSSDGSARSAVTGDVVSSNHGTTNFRVYWDGDLQEELLDGNKIDKWNGDGTSRIYINGKDLYNQGGPASTCNGSKNTPCLQADILGDWREEIILHNDNQIAIYTTNTATNYRIPTLMHDHTYRMGICWQNVAYNQPPHLGYYLPDAMEPQFLSTQELTVEPDEPIAWTLKWRYAKAVTISASYLPDGTRKALIPPTGLTRTTNNTDRTFTLTGALSEKGDYRIETKMTALDGTTTVIKPLTIHVGTTDTGIQSVQSVATELQQTENQVFDLQGRRRSEMKPGEIYIIRQKGKAIKVIK